MRKQTKQERAAYFSGGRATVGTVGVFNKRTREFSSRFVGKVRGKIVTGPKGTWKFKSEAAALKAAQWFLAHCKTTAASA